MWIIPGDNFLISFYYTYSVLVCKVRKAWNTSYRLSYLEIENLTFEQEAGSLPRGWLSVVKSCE
jgi:hypothetical protein